MLSTGLIFYPWFKFYFPLFLTHYHTLPYPKTRENKFKLRITLNHNVYVDSHIFMLIFNYIFLLHLKMTLERSKCYDFQQGCQKVFKQQADNEQQAALELALKGIFSKLEPRKWHFQGFSRANFHREQHVVLSEYMQNWEQCRQNVPGVPRHHTVRKFHRSKPLFKHSMSFKTGKRKLYNFIRWCIFLLAVVYAKRRGKQPAKDG